MDPYLEEKNVVERLVREWKTHKQLIIAYDFDNTVFDYHNEGHNYDLVIQLLRELKEINTYLMVYTARGDEELGELRNYLEKENIPFDSINEQPAFLPFRGKKLYFNLLLDDRAGLSSAYRCLKEALKIIKTLDH